VSKLLKWNRRCGIYSGLRLPDDIYGPYTGFRRRERGREAMQVAWF
jgi:hypothetical protein